MFSGSLYSIDNQQVLGNYHGDIDLKNSVKFITQASEVQKGLFLNVCCHKSKHATQIPIVALHGFTGSGADFLPLIEGELCQHDFYAVDLMGHGHSSVLTDPKYYTFEFQVQCLSEAIRSLGLSQYVLLGYSLGGRLALHYALQQHPGLRGLIVVGANPGVQDAKERAKRYDLDKEWVCLLENEGVRGFIDKWQAQPLIATQRDITSTLYKEMLDRRYQSHAKGLKNTLMQMSPGVTPSLWEELPKIQIPCMLVAGAKDSRYVDISQTMSKSIPQSEVCIIPDAGHMAHIENANTFIDASSDWIKRCVNHA